MKILLNQNQKLESLRKYVDLVDKDGEVYFMYIQDEPVICQELGLREGDGPILISELGEPITKNEMRMRSYIKGRFAIEPSAL